ncbi:MAG: MarR family winged helix-turn-helix transcriptional regulator [Rhodospirillales bacterium]|jgi:DNA-binding MarR family transcriptional regulator|nr:MarR family winged helix-turn-helix transcriptional regulator [Rhodospirillales bacterium]|tara:strand:- start:240 stop:704 length:465 start_codon:yes stop_codon:yes gene_type:complete
MPDDQKMQDNKNQYKFRDRLLPHLLARASHSLSEKFMAEVRNRGFTARQWRVMGSLWDEDSMTLTELSDVVFCEQSTTTRLVDRLVELKLLGKRLEKSDRRKAHIYLTARGRKQIGELVKLSEQHEKETAELFGVDQVEDMKRRLHEMIDFLKT